MLDPARSNKKNYENNSKNYIIVINKNRNNKI